MISLDGFDPPFGCSEYVWGPAATHDGQPWKEHQYHAEILSWHYHDYMGTHALLQVWDYAQQADPAQRWQYVLVLHYPKRYTDPDGVIIDTDWRWAIRMEYESNWAERKWPTNAEVGADIDQWLQAPEALRFLLV